MVTSFATIATTYSYIWFGWLVAFVVIEGSALLIFKSKDSARNTGGTLSELIWRITKSNRLVFALFSLFWVVLAIHFFLQ